MYDNKSILCANLPDLKTTYTYNRYTASRNPQTIGDVEKYFIQLILSTVSS
ncbi:hypothetical protein [Paraflavitalea speifideaquila]|uniref:hypothetical protein n=1 Tax=Paraflavitalea speifideaquila TaxID=3076558 RepID=UPI0028EA35E6|nr:hypothetical protein [Paraflavitalea speifideiaquila]